MNNFLFWFFEFELKMRTNEVEEESLSRKQCSLFYLVLNHLVWFELVRHLRFEGWFIIFILHDFAHYQVGRNWFEEDICTHLFPKSTRNKAFELNEFLLLNHAIVNSLQISSDLILTVIRNLKLLHGCICVINVLLQVNVLTVVLIH